MLPVLLVDEDSSRQLEQAQLREETSNNTIKSGGSNARASPAGCWLKMPTHLQRRETFTKGFGVVMTGLEPVTYSLENCCLCPFGYISIDFAFSMPCSEHASPTAKNGDCAPLVQRTQQRFLLFHFGERNKRGWWESNPLLTVLQAVARPSGINLVHSLLIR